METEAESWSGSSIPWQGNERYCGPLGHNRSRGLHVDGGGALQRVDGVGDGRYPSCRGREREAGSVPVLLALEHRQGVEQVVEQVVKTETRKRPVGIVSCQYVDGG